MKNFLIPLDKANHVIYGYLIYVISCFFLSPFLSFIPVILISAIKEYIDMKNYEKEFDYLDFFVTIVGAIPASILNFI